MSYSNPRQEMLAILLEHSFHRNPEPTFRLASGKLSDLYIDCRATTMRSAAMPLVGAVIEELLPMEAEAVGGLTLGADPIALATAYGAGMRGRSLNAFSVRKEAKSYGLRRWVEGCVEKGTKVVVVDDVVTTGGSTVKAIKRCREEGIEVVGVVVLVDRQEGGGMANIQRVVGRGVPVKSVFTRRELEATARVIFAKIEGR